jgi:hypothetical protein
MPRYSTQVGGKRKHASAQLGDSEERGENNVTQLDDIGY